METVGHTEDRMSISRPALRYFGGKWRLAPWIIENLPPHRVYVEPFGGAASVLLRKPRSYSEVYNDRSGEIVRFFRVLQNQVLAVELERKLRLTPFSRDEFDLAYEETNDPVEEARRLVVRSFMGFGSGGHNAGAGKTGFRANANRSGTAPAHDWASYPDQISFYFERLSGVCIENRDAIEVMGQQDSIDTLHFLDPPYVHSTRGDKKHSYEFEMTDEEHMRLCEFIQTLRGLVVLCGYRNDIYESLGWTSVERAAFADGARERTEVLWFNPAAWSRRAQMEMFGGATA